MSCIKITSLRVFVVIIFVISVSSSTQDVKPIFNIDGDVNVAIFVKNCENTSKTVPYHVQSFVNAAVWTAERVNFLEFLAPLKLGIAAYEVCEEIDYFKTVFDLYQQDQKYFLGIITEDDVNEKISRYSDVLDIPVKHTQKIVESLTHSSTLILYNLGWIENVIIIAPNEDILRLFYKYAKKEMVCVKECHIYEENCPLLVNITGDPFVIFGSKTQLQEFVKKEIEAKGYENNINALFVPTDGSVPLGKRNHFITTASATQDLPENSFVLIPPHSPATKTYKKSSNILPSPVLFEVAKPILNYIKPTTDFTSLNCSETIYKVNCLRNKFNKKFSPVFHTPISILKLLLIEPLRPYFVYDVFKVLNESENITELSRRNNYLQPIKKVFTYNIFDQNLTIIDPDFEISVTYNETKPISCQSSYFVRNNNNKLVNSFTSNLNFRTESWVYAFLSLSLLGVLFCVAILTFLIVSICRRDILEGNPILTLILLLCIMLLFCAVLPFSLQENRVITKTLCTVKALSVTLAYSAVFSLLLSRSILLATASKEIGFMSHIAGPVQSFLCLFIFGVQAALSLQIVGRCSDFFQNYAFLYLMSYNTMLLVLMLCLTPLIYKCQRNYREGKYFTFAIVLTTLIWIIWIPLYIVLDKLWKEAMLCLGLFGTGAVILGTVFIPRTYLMTIAAARDKITSALPSLATATSTMDIYRANSQPIYDCVNFAAINAVSVARAGVSPSTPATQQPDLYSCPALPEDDSFDFQCETPPSDKVTRF